MIGSRTVVGRSPQGLRSVQRFIVHFAPGSVGGAHGDHLERGPASVKHRKPGAAPDPFHHVRQRGAQFFGVDDRIHWFTLS